MTCKILILLIEFNLLLQDIDIKLNNFTRHINIEQLCQLRAICFQGKNGKKLDTKLQKIF